MVNKKDVVAMVKLVRLTPNPEAVIASSARLCYASDVVDVGDGSDSDYDSDVKLIHKLKSLGHMSPFEHVAFTFYVTGISRACSHQLIRHRLASYSQRSQRYVRHGDFRYVVPPQLYGKKVIVGECEVDAVDYYHDTMDILSTRYGYLNKAMGETGEKSNEDARYILPNACETMLVMTVNARELMHILEARLCGRAQWEIRLVADQMLQLVKGVCPAVFNGVGPKCVNFRRCYEGSFSCGQLQEMINKYQKDE